MPSYRISRAAELLGVSTDTVRRLVESGRLASVEDGDGRHRLVDGAALAEFARTQAPAGRQVTIVSGSARNRFPGLVTRVVRDGVMAQVEMQAGPHRVVSLLSREAADELGLEVGVVAVASVKATNVVIELPGDG